MMVSMTSIKVYKRIVQLGYYSIRFCSTSFSVVEKWDGEKKTVKDSIHDLLRFSYQRGFEINSSRCVLTDYMIIIAEIVYYYQNQNICTRILSFLHAVYLSWICSSIYVYLTSGAYILNAFYIDITSHKA